MRRFWLKYLDYPDELDELDELAEQVEVAESEHQVQEAEFEQDQVETQGQVDCRKIMRNSLTLERNSGKKPWRKDTTPADIVAIPNPPKRMGGNRRNAITFFYWPAASYIDNNKDEKDIFSGLRLDKGHVAIVVYVPKVEDNDNVFYCLSATPGQNDFRSTPLLDLDHGAFDNAPAYDVYKNSHLEMLNPKSVDNKTAWLTFLRGHHKELQDGTEFTLTTPRLQWPQSSSATPAKEVTKKQAQTTSF